jgi:hypothetical protein
MTAQFRSLPDLWASRARARLLAFLRNSGLPDQEAGDSSDLEPWPRIPVGTQMKAPLGALQ